MAVPRNVFWFEVLLYSSLMLDSLSVAFQDRTPRADASASTIAIAAVVVAGITLFQMHLVRLAAENRKNGPRWILFAFLVISLLSMPSVIAETGLQLDSAIGIVSCLLTGAGLYLSFTGDAKGWVIS